MKDRSVEIRTQSHDAGDVEDNVDADYGGEEMTIAFNPSFLIDVSKPCRVTSRVGDVGLGATGNGARR